MMDTFTWIDWLNIWTCIMLTLLIIKTILG